MKTNLVLLNLIMVVFIQSCGSNMVKNKEQLEKTELDTSATRVILQIPKADTNLIIHNKKDLIGYWVGMFEPDSAIHEIYAGETTAWDYKNKINISIDSIAGTDVIGHSVVAGNYRPFKGTLTKENSLFHIIVKEPGTDKYDGTFDFTIAMNVNSLTGKWKAYGKIRIPARNYVLTKKNFSYKPDLKLVGGQYVDWAKTKKAGKTDRYYKSDYDISYFTTTNDVYKYNASTDTLTKDQVANLKKADLFILRNSIYARHGYSFKNQQLRAYFDRQSWYIPVSTNIKSELTGIEKQNITLLMRYENNAAEYYDAFGRG